MNETHSYIGQSLRKTSYMHTAQMFLHATTISDARVLTQKMLSHARDVTQKSSYNNAKKFSQQRVSYYVTHIFSMCLHNKTQEIDTTWHAGNCANLHCKFTV